MTSTLRKRMFSFEARVFQELEREALDRGVSVQELVRAVIIPDWFRMQAVFKEQRIVFVRDTLREPGLIRRQP